MDFNLAIAKVIVGKYILIGLSYFSHDGVLESQQQLHGKVERASEKEGIIVELFGDFRGEKVQLPPDTSTITPAEPGLYKLSTTEEEIENPDYLCTFEVHKSA